MKTFKLILTLTLTIIVSLAFTATSQAVVNTPTIDAGYNVDKQCNIQSGWVTSSGYQPTDKIEVNFTKNTYGDMGKAYYPVNQTNVTITWPQGAKTMSLKVVGSTTSYKEISPQIVCVKKPAIEASATCTTITVTGENHPSYDTKIVLYKDGNIIYEAPLTSSNFTMDIPVKELKDTNPGDINIKTYWTYNKKDYLMAETNTKIEESCNTKPASIKKKMSLTKQKTVKITLTATNPNKTTIENIVLTDKLPDNLNNPTIPKGCKYTTATKTITCTITNLKAGKSKTFTITAVPTLNQAATITNTASNEKLDVTKQETYLSMFKQTNQYSVSCPTGYKVVDSSIIVLSVDSGQNITDVQLISKTLTDNGNTVTAIIENNTDGQAQGKLFVTCLKETTNEGKLTITYNKKTVEAEEGTGQQTATCPTGTIIVSPTLSSPSPVLTTGYDNKGTITYNMLEAGTLTYQWGCLNLTSSTGNMIKTNLLTQKVVVEPNTTKETRLTCDGTSKGIVAGWNSPYRVGNEPQPVTRVFYFNNPTNQTQTFTASLLCVDTRLFKTAKQTQPTTINNTLEGTQGNLQLTPSKATLTIKNTTK